MKLTKRARSRDPRCPFCHDDVRANPWSCPRCATYHHDGCAIEHGKCAVHGCGGSYGEAPRIERPLPAAPRPTESGLVTAWEVFQVACFVIALILKLLGPF
jgi:hypothetical protein